MCVSPITVTVNGLAQTVACRKCKQCRDNRVRDYVGRCIAESKTSVATSYITLTYGTNNRINGADDILQAKVLTYSDVQGWLKRLRRAGYPLRYMLAGEYGSAKGRAHWHVIAFWQDRVPPHPEDYENWWQDPFWTKHEDSAGGHSNWREFDVHAAVYVCKYLLKDEEDASAQSHFQLSKKPPLGAEWFRRFAERYVEQGIVPSDGEYFFPDVRVKKTGLPRKFMMRGKALDIFCRHFVERWRERYGSDPLDLQHTDFLMAYFDRHAQRPAGGGVRPLAFRSKPHIPVPIYQNGQALKPRFDEKRNAYWYADLDGVIWWWSFDREGHRAWRDVLVTETEAKALRAASARQSSPAAYREASRGK